MTTWTTIVDGVPVESTSGAQTPTTWNAESGRLAAVNAADITFTPTGTGAVDSTVQAKLRSTVSVTDFGAVGNGIIDDTAAIQSAIDYVEILGGGVVKIPAGVFLISSSLTVDDNGVLLVGEGCGGHQNSIPEIRASAATRIVFSTSATAAPMLIFTSVTGHYPKGGGGCCDIMLDGANKATRCLSITSWRWGTFSNVHLYAATEDNLYTGAISASLPVTPYDVQFCKFYGIISHSKNATANASYACRLTGGQGNSGASTGNTSFNTFINCFFNSNNQHALQLEDTDNNTFIGIQAKADAATFKSLILGSSDEDSGNSAYHARFNNFNACEFVDGIVCKASQTGGRSSASNQFYGLNYSNSAPSPTIETGDGGSDDATAIVFSSSGLDIVPARNYTVAALPTKHSAGQILFASNGRKAGEGAGVGTGVMVFSDGTNWIACDTGATVAA